MSGNIRERRNWTSSVTIVVILAVAAVITGYLVDVEADSTDRLYFRNTAGAVLFDHGKHSQQADSCAQCHHDLYAAAQSTTCVDCHDDEPNIDEFNHSDLKDIHDRDCSLCHQQKYDDDQAVSCRSCHPGSQESETLTVNCTKCHDDDYSPDMLDHDEYLETEDHSCLGCHTPRSVSSTYHLNCSNCHLETAPERFAQDDGKVQCGACHLR